MPTIPSNEDKRQLSETIEWTEKGQFTRLIDVFALGPFMMWYAAKWGPEMNSMYAYLTRSALSLGGFLTVLYNGWNFLINEGAALKALPL